MVPHFLNKDRLQSVSQRNKIENHCFRLQVDAWRYELNIWTRYNLVQISKVICSHNYRTCHFHYRY